MRYDLSALPNNRHINRFTFTTIHNYYNSTSLLELLLALVLVASVLPGCTYACNVKLKEATSEDASPSQEQ
jgi:hypothetical protein